MNLAPARPPAHRARALLAVVVTLLLGLAMSNLAPTATAATATAPAAASRPQAATPEPSAANRFWGYYQLTDGQWTFAPTGPQDAAPADGSVEGWRYAAAAMNDARYPRATLTFEQICGRTPAQDGFKRVGVLIDYGRTVDGVPGANPPATRADCAVVPTDANGTDVLTALAAPRLDGAMLCGIDGYPASGCFEEVASPAPEALAPDEPVTPVIGAGAPADTDQASPSAPGEQTAHTATDAVEQSGAVDAATWVIVGLLIVLAFGGALALTLLRHRRQR